MSRHDPIRCLRFLQAHRQCLLIILTATYTGLLSNQADAQDFGPAEIEFFEKSVRPLLVNKCQSCHGPAKAEGDLRLDSRAGVLKGGSRGTAAIEQHAETSLIISAVGYGVEDLKMPPDSKLSDEEQSILSQWIARGLPWPAGEELESVANHGWTDARIAELRKEHWSFRSVISPDVPSPTNTAWATTDVDRFLLTTMEQTDLTPASETDRRTLLRRVTYDLTGLPPKAENVDAFLADGSPEAWTRVIDRLLASPQYGEHWGRHWLDVARYADSSGKDENHACANAFQYRDYVIRSLNADKPYDRFVREQIAGDLMTFETEQERFDGITATGFLQMGQKALAEQDKEKMLLDIADEQLDTISRGMLGLTISCARCHDHKFDPIRTQEYYSLAGILRSTKTMENLAFVSTWQERPLVPQAELDRIAAHAKMLADAKQQLTQLTEQSTKSPLAEADSARLEQLKKDVAERERTLPVAPMAMAVSDGDVADLKVHIRGNHLNHGPVAARSFPSVLQVANTPVIPASLSGRLQLAEWMTRPDHPLTARVIVNRVWQWHFGKGLCRSTDNFGLRGETPDHPELLDWLAARFVSEGWSLMQLHRTILQSRAYQMAGRPSNVAPDQDPENRLLSYFPRRRLSAEELRDSLLVVSGQLDLTLGGNLFNYANREAHVTYYKGPVNYDFPRRTVYLPVVRSAMYDVLELFDHGAALTSVPQRDETTIAPQALYLMNSPLVLKAAEQLSASLFTETDVSDHDRLQTIYRKVFQRPASDHELSRGVAFLQQLETQMAGDDRQRMAYQALCQSLLISNEFLYVE
jgi:cytochrome c553